MLRLAAACLLVSFLFSFRLAVKRDRSRSPISRGGGALALGMATTTSTATTATTEMATATTARTATTESATRPITRDSTVDDVAAWFERLPLSDTATKRALVDTVRAARIDGALFCERIRSVGDLEKEFCVRLVFADMATLNKALF